MEAIREVVNKQIEIIKNADADASSREEEIARTDLGRYFDRFADKLDKTQTNTEVAELQNVTIPAIEAIVPRMIQMLMILIMVQIIMMQQQIQMLMQHQKTLDNLTFIETTDNGKADASPTTPNNSDAATGETTVTSATDDEKDKPQANNNSSADASTNSPTMDNDVTSKPEVESTNNGTTDKPVTETDNATPAKAQQITISTATNENAPTGSTATAPTTASTEAASSADSKDNASVNDSKQNAEVNNSAESQSTNGKVAQPKSENKAKAEKDGRDIQQIKLVEWTD